MAQGWYADKTVPFYLYESAAFSRYTVCTQRHNKLLVC